MRVSGLLLNLDNLDALPTHRDFIALGLSEQSAGQRCVVRQGAVGRIGLISTDDAIRLLLAVAANPNRRAELNSGARALLLSYLSSCPAGRPITAVAFCARKLIHIAGSKRFGVVLFGLR